MKVYLGPYRNWFGPYQCVDFFLKPFGVSENVREKIAEWLPEKPFWIIHKLKKRFTYVKLDRWDTWNFDLTLAMIILPGLKQLRDTKHGSPYVDDEDVPAALHSTVEPAVHPEQGDIDGKHHERWEYVLNEMIWAFERIANEETDWYSLDDVEMNKRIANGTRLFGKYFQALWD